MIITSMTSDEVIRHIKNDMAEGLMTFIHHKKNDWLKYRKHLLPRQYGFQCYKWTNKHTNQQYVFTFTKSKCMEKVPDSLTVYAEVSGARKQYYCLNINTGDICICSSHFFNRYAERTGIPAVYPAIIGKFHANNVTHQIIYADPVDTPDRRRFVYAVNDGIILGEIENRRKVYIFRTFVSLDMLKDTQRQAYNVVSELLSATAKCYEYAANRNILPEVLNDLCLVTANVSIDASKIYAQFWEDED